VLKIVWRHTLFVWVHVSTCFGVDEDGGFEVVRVKATPRKSSVELIRSCHLKKILTSKDFNFLYATELLCLGDSSRRRLNKNLVDIISCSTTYRCCYVRKAVWSEFFVAAEVDQFNTRLTWYRLCPNYLKPTVFINTETSWLVETLTHANKVCRHTIMSTLSNDLFDVYCPCKEAKEIWDSMFVKYGKRLKMLEKKTLSLATMNNDRRQILRIKSMNIT